MLTNIEGFVDELGHFVRIRAEGVTEAEATKAGRALFAELCEKTYCALGMSCVVSESGQAMCQCPAACPDSHAPVCGNDGVTYANHCQLRRTNCQRRRDTRVKHQGACGKSQHAAMRRVCLCCVPSSRLAARPRHSPSPAAVPFIVIRDTGAICLTFVGHFPAAGYRSPIPSFAFDFCRSRLKCSAGIAGIECRFIFLVTF